MCDKCIDCVFYEANFCHFWELTIQNTVDSCEAFEERDIDVVELTDTELLNHAYTILNSAYNLVDKIEGAASIDEVVLADIFQIESDIALMRKYMLTQV